jgi:hypothetical protein
MPTEKPSPADLFQRLSDTAATAGAPAMLAALAADCRTEHRWHSLFDVRMLEARLAAGLPVTGEIGRLEGAAREAFDERSIAACREAGWPLLEEGHIAAAWMYLRAAAEHEEVVSRLAAIVSRPDLADRDGVRGEAMHLALGEGLDPALGIRLVLEDHGTCSGITAYMQAVARLPAARRRPAADVLVDHLHAECVGRLAEELSEKGIGADAIGRPASSAASIPDLIAAADRAGLATGLHVDASHLNNVLLIARECTDPAHIGRAWELALYAGHIPPDLLMAGEPPFEELAEAAQLFFAAELGRDIQQAVDFFSRKVSDSPGESLPAEWLVVLLARVGRAGEALQAALEFLPGPDERAGQPSTGLVPSLVDLATASGTWEPLLEACHRRDDPVTFAAALAAYHQCQPKSPPRP